MFSATNRLPSRRLSTQILVLQLGIIVIVVAASFVIAFLRARHNLDRQAGQKSLAIAQVVAATPDIVNAFSAPHPARAIDPIAERMRRATGAAFIVIANRQGIRYSHPDPAEIGKSLLHDPGEPVTAVLAGQTQVGVQTGSLGRSVRAKVPLRDAKGRIVGLVSVGVLETAVGEELVDALPSLLIPLLAVLLVGTLAVLLLGRRVRRQTFGLDAGEIATLVEQREAMLHAVREGAITVDAHGQVTLLNDEAKRLLELDDSALGHQLAEIVPDGRIREVLTGQVEGADQVILAGDRVLVANRMPVEVRGRPIGAVVTLRDRTELNALVGELNEARDLADALRAQEHDFQHRLHVISGLIELGRHDDAVQEINRASSLHQELAGSLVDGSSDPTLAALLLGKASVASERGVKLHISAFQDVSDSLADVQALAAMLGNLIDNAIDSAAHAGAGGHVDISLVVENGELIIRVHDSGAGVSPALSEEIFRDGYTTKVARQGGRRRGLGLALVSQEVRRRGGRITVDNIDGALFTVAIPLRSSDVDLAASSS
ncbi:MAG TPA: sensor histidine kinase [Gaiellaceae bacterium]|nr:sensor histidine kinase [Gaiellaceae bacterium]